MISTASLRRPPLWPLVSFIAVSSALFALLAFFQSPAAHALQSHSVGPVVVESGQSVPEVSALGSIKVFGSVEGDVKSATGSILVDGPVGGDVESAMGSIEVNAPVAGTVESGLGDVVINAPVNGDVDVERGSVFLGPKARVDNVYCGSGSYERAPGAQVAGEFRAGPSADLAGSPGDDGSTGFFGFIGWAFAAALFAALAVLVSVLAPRPLAASSRMVGEAPVRSLLAGFGTVVAAVVLFAVLLVSGIGIPILILLAPVYLTFVFFGAVVVAFFVGRKVVFMTGRYRHGNTLAAIVGALIVAAVNFLPLGFVLLWVLALLGAGAAVVALFSRRPPHSIYTSYLRSRERHRV